MDADFVNVFVEKQRETITDLFSRNIMLDARVTFAEQKIQQLLNIEQQSVDQREQYEKTLAEAQAGHDRVVLEYKSAAHKLNGEIGRLQAEVNAAAGQVNEINSLQTKVKDQTADIEQLRKAVNQMSLERETHRAKAENLKKKAKQLMED